MMVERVVDALRGLRVQPQGSEAELHAVIEALLGHEGIRFGREVRLGPRCRIDFLCEGGVGIEVKKGIPNGPAVRAQVARYCAWDGVRALVLVVERHVVGAPVACAGKAVHYVGLSKNWGVAV